MRASTRLRVSAPTSAQPRTTLETVITLTLRSRAMSFRRTGVVGACAMSRRPHRDGRYCSNAVQNASITSYGRGWRAGGDAMDAFLLVPGAGLEPALSLRRKGF